MRAPCAYLEAQSSGRVGESPISTVPRWTEEPRCLERSTAWPYTRNRGECDGGRDLRARRRGRGGDRGRRALRCQEAPGDGVVGRSSPGRVQEGCAEGRVEDPTGAPGSDVQDPENP